MAAPQPNGISARRMLDQYEVVAEIASGGMGTVYLARLARAGGFQRMVALKLLHRHLAEEKHFVSMLLDEARLAARLHHPNAVGILDVKESELGYYLVMDYVDGFAMDDVLDRARSHEERMRLGIRILLDATTGLDAAHRLMDDEGRPLEIVHRDVSPQNVLVGRDGVGRITDFGVARAAERITSSRPGTIKGKPCYMAPEQAECRELDARADLFALGIVLWETLTGQLLFESEEGTMSILLAVLQRPIPVPSQVCPEVPLALERVCMKALERNVDARYQSGREFIDALTEAAAQSGMLVGSHAVADGIREIFSADLEARQAAVRAHVSAIEKLPISAMTLGDLHKVPRLGSMPEASALYSGVRNSHAGSDEWFEEGGSVPPPGRVDPTSETIALQSRMERPTAPSARPASHSAPLSARPRASSRSWVLAVVGLVVGLLIAVGGFLAFRASQANVAGPAPTPPTSVGAAPTAPALAVPTAPETTPTVAPAATAPSTAAGGEHAAGVLEAAPGTDEPVAGAPTVGAGTDAPSAEPEGSMAHGATGESTHRSRSSSSRPRTEASMTAPSEPAPMVDMSPPTPTLEINPYTR